MPLSPPMVGSRSRNRLGGGVDRLHPVDRRARLGGASFLLELLVEDLQLLERFAIALLLRELLGEHQPDVVLVGTEVGEFLERAERLIEPAGLLHPIGVLEIVLLRVAREPLLRADAPELVVDRRPAGRGAEDLVAERDGVVEESALGVEVDRLLVVLDRLRDVALTHHEIADPVVQGDVGVLLVAAQLPEQVDVDGERLVELLLLLQLSCFFLELRDVGHQRGESGGSGANREAQQGPPGPRRIPPNLPVSHGGDKLCPLSTTQCSVGHQTSKGALARPPPHGVPNLPKIRGRAVRFPLPAPGRPRR
jgi:hypothetical protein